MPSYVRLLTEQPGNIATPPTGNTALYASSGTGGENKYQLYIKNPEGFTYQVGGMGSASTFSSNTTFTSGATVYSGGYSSSGSPLVAIAVQGVISGLTDSTVYISPGLNVSGTTSGTTNLIYGTGLTSTGFYNQNFGSGNTVSQSAATSFGSGNTVNAPAAFAVGGVNTASGQLSFVGGSANTTSGFASFAFGSGNTASGAFAASFGTGNTVSHTATTSFGSANTVSAPSAFAIGGSNTASGQLSFAAGSATTSTGTSHFSIGNGNAFSNLFTIGNGSGVTNNIFTVTQSGVTVQSSGTSTNNISRYSGSPAAALTVFSGSGSHPLGFQLPLVQSPYGGTYGTGIALWPDLSASTSMGTGMLIFDGSNIRMWTGGTKWATIALHGDGGSF